jgi:hypothetical protein
MRCKKLNLTGALSNAGGCLQLVSGQHPHLHSGIPKKLQGFPDSKLQPEIKRFLKCHRCLINTGVEKMGGTDIHISGHSYKQTFIYLLLRVDICIQ